MRTACLITLLLPGLLAGQAPRIGIIDFYGLKKVSEASVRKVLTVKEGDPLPPSKSDVEEAIEQLPGVVLASLEAVCCEAGKAILYVGIEEKGASHFALRSVPDGDAMLSTDILDTYQSFLDSVQEAVRQGETGEDLTAGHSMMQNAAARRAQEKFLTIAAAQLSAIRDTLLTSRDEQHRAIAAYLIGYAPDKQAVVNDLQTAMQDPDETVRSNAMRSLGAMMVLSQRKPDLGLKVSPTWFVEMLNSILWNDRHSAAVALVNLTESRDSSVLDSVRERGIDSIAGMARWKHLPHSLPGYILLGRVAGFPEKEIQDSWSTGDQEDFITRALKQIKK